MNKQYIIENKIYDNNIKNVDVANLSHQDTANKHELITLLKEKSTINNNELYKNIEIKIYLIPNG